MEGVWKVYEKIDRYRVGRETPGGPFWYESIPGTFWESSVKEDAFIQAKYLNTPKIGLNWKVIEE